MTDTARKHARTRQAALLVAGFTVLAILWRLWDAAPNVAPVAALALFAGWATGRAWIGAATALTVLISSDLMLGRLETGFAYDWRLQAVVWGALVLPAVFAHVLPRRAGRAFVWCLAPALAGAAAFFIVTNFAVWALGDAYPHTLAGLIDCYMMAIPFFRATVAGDVLFSLLLFGAAALAERRLASSRVQTA